MAAHVAPSYALWPFGDDNDTAVVEAPPAHWKDDHCEPFRLKAIRLNQTMASWNPIRGFRVARLKQQHRKCIRTFEDQEYAYLKATPIGKQPTQ